MFMEDVEDNVLSATDSDDESHIECLQFYPPVYIQRYALVKNILSKHSVESVSICCCLFRCCMYL